MTLVILVEISFVAHGVYLWPVWGVELILLFAYWRIGKRVLKLLARKRGNHAD